MKTMVLSLLLLGVAGQGSVAMAQSAGTFTATGNMTTGRFGHTATLLADGRVLIGGGGTDENGINAVPPFGRAITATAELYDPATGTFTATGNMTSARAYHAATLLPDGRVLIVAGHAAGGSGGNLTSAELYDPSTGTFTATGNMTTPSVNDANTATLLPDGRVLLAQFDFYSASKLYDPRTGTFGLTGTTFAAGRATLLPNGKVLATGGNDDPGPIAGAAVYDPATGIFTATGNMTAPRTNHTATLLPDGKALIAGGSSWIGTNFGVLQGMSYLCCLTSVELYDSATGLFATTGGMAAGRAGHTATLLNSGEVLIAGGSGGGNPGALDTAELYHPEAPVLPPVLLSLSDDGKGQGAIQHAGTYQLVSPGNPAVAGEALILYCTGLADGSVIPPQVAIGGRMAEVLWFGNTPGFAGLNQINIRVPSGVTPGATVPVRLNYIGRPSNEVTIGVQ